ncbi:MAG: hypothetical protein CMD46_02300 [Gammaproteobacteria bacterium]|nr:hypothetical protein [Gammaproteobacteria bacterium]
MKLLILIMIALSVTAQANASSCEKAELFFEYPNNGFVSEGSKFKVIFGSKNISINPAGVIVDDDIEECMVSGHHHLIINDEYDVNNSKDMPIPYGKNILHFGGGQTEAELSLPPGKYSLQLALGDYEHKPVKPIGSTNNYKPITSDKIYIEVSEGA